MALGRTVSWVLFVFVTTTGSAATWTVDNSGSCSDTACSPCCTIQGAIGKASGGDIVSVADGSYPENIDFRGMLSIGDITLKAAATPGNVLVSPTFGHTVRHGDGHTNTVTIEGITFDSTELDKSCVYLDHAGDVVLRDVVANHCAYTAFVLDNTGSVTMERCTANNSARNGIQIDGSSGAVLDSCTTNSNTQSGVLIINVAGAGLAETIDSVTLTNLQSNDNDGDGVLLEDIVGPVTVTNCSFENNGGEGLGIFNSALDDLVITGGHATGNANSGYNVDVSGDGAIDGAQASTNGEGGFRFRFSGTVSLTNCVANQNETAAGIRVFQSTSTVDEVTITNCTTNNNGLTSGGNGVYVKDVAGPVTISGVTATGNSRTNIRVDATAGAILISDSMASSSPVEEGIKIDADVGPVTVQNCTVDGNALEGILITKENVDVETITVTENSVTNNTTTGVSLSNLSPTGTFDATCNDIAGNGNGLYHSSAVTVDARYVWWGDPSGPSGKGAGSGDTVWYEPGGNILFAPWLEESCTGCNGIVHMTLMDDSVTTAETYKSCYSITVGPSFAVYGPSGDLTLTAREVVFENGFSVDVDGALTVSNQ